ncbi:MAG: hypothetical protein KAX05_15735 [Bacteroidales bacterium]|nr:hypothetical protein [Bacteroidales bacterium]
MGNFIWQDLLALAAAFFGAIESARKMPNYPNDKYLARFVLGFHITIIVALFCTMANPNVDLWGDVDWLVRKANFQIPLLVYTLIVAFGISRTLNLGFQSVIVKFSGNQFIFVSTALLMAFWDLFILGHIMWIF